VELLPATVPPDYWADVFVSIHADGNKNPAVSGYKVASPWRDTTGKADELTTMLKREYGAATDLAVDPNVTRNMRGYYAFNWRRYEHSIHPMTVATIIETSFLTSPHDQHTIIHNADESAHGIANGIKVFLINQELLLE
ncbi:MAG: N-acetylmuramoyl-L-alanine amidase, partial [Acidobacteriota bacterium]